jgi:hypothetical protein
MRRLVFIDDDETELGACRDIVGGSYEYETVHWPKGSAKLFDGPKPDIFFLHSFGRHSPARFCVSLPLAGAIVQQPSAT